jgi:hypothetical protein
MPIVRPEPNALSELCAELEPIVREVRAKDPLYSYRDAALSKPGKDIVSDWCRRHEIDLELQPSVAAMLECE